MTAKAFFSLVRIPTAFSSMSNIYAGYLIGGGRLSWELLLGLFAGAFFIMGGMALNDVADAKVDARERPSRPIPSGAISRAGALRLSLALLFSGTVLIAIANPLALIPAAALIGCIALYNFIFKGGPLGPLSMGACRACNLATGIVLTWETWPQYFGFNTGIAFALVSLASYIMLVTYLAHEEVRGTSWRRLRVFLGGLTLWGLGWLSFSVFMLEGEYALYAIMVMAAIFAALYRPLRALSAQPSPKNTGKTVGSMLRLIPLIDVLAMLANLVAVPWALLGLLWILPGYFIGRYFYST